ncbi:flavin reductase [Clostridium massiliamazoniense]|uniref:flavin reductase n=1 Tax=Clostridium massiliamazoniense TaxID=1347366 RepID=UPI0006D8620B|nr:flavin reductase [Clostridium massiliamazoniense]
MENFKEINVDDLKESAFKLIGKDWMLITAEKEGQVNTMTASWGGLGVMWGKNVAYIVVRPQRYTKEFIDHEGRFTLTFFDKSFKKELGYLGSVSGRDEDKISKSGLTLNNIKGKPYFEEGKIVIVCKKLYSQYLKPENFVDADLCNHWYPEKDYHEMYIAEVEEILVK